MPGRKRAAKAEVDADDDYYGSSSPPAAQPRRASRAAATGARSAYLPVNVDELERAYARASAGVDDEGTSFAGSGNPKALLPGSGMTEEEFLSLPPGEQKKQRRLIRNRLSAHLHRERQRGHIAALEGQVVELAALVDVAAVTFREVLARCTCATGAAAVVTAALAHACGPAVTGNLGCTTLTAEDVAAKRAAVARTFAANATLAEAAVAASAKPASKRAGKAAPVAAAGSKRSAVAGLESAPAAAAAVRKRPRRSRAGVNGDDGNDDDDAGNGGEEALWDGTERRSSRSGPRSAAPPAPLELPPEHDDDDDDAGDDGDEDAVAQPQRVSAPPSPLDHLAAVAALAESAPAAAKRGKGVAPVTAPSMRRMFTMDDSASVAVPPSPPLLPVVAPPPTALGLVHAPSPLAPSPATSINRAVAIAGRVTDSAIDDFAARYSFAPNDVRFLHDMLARSHGSSAMPFDLNALMTVHRGAAGGGGFSLNDLMRDTGHPSSALVPAASQQTALAHELRSLTDAQRNVFDRFVADQQPEVRVPQHPSLPHIHSFDAVREDHMNSMKLPMLSHVGSFDVSVAPSLTLHRMGSLEPGLPGETPIAAP